jgi:hypothetical protein
MDHDGDEFDGLPDDFNIDWSIPKINTVLTRLPLTIQSYHLIMRLENQRAEKKGRMYLYLFLYKHVTVCITCLIELVIECRETFVY